MSLFRFAFAVIAFAGSACAFASDLGVSVSIGQPGFYGRIEIGDMPRPRLLYPEPVVIEVAPAHVVRNPLYLRVPPGHVKHWDKHCAEYGACGQPVYFVDDDWYENVYVSEYEKKHGKHHGKKSEKGHGKDKGKDKGHK